jgi:hypothetical protein
MENKKKKKEGLIRVSFDYKICISLKKISVTTLAPRLANWLYKLIDFFLSPI